MKKIICTRILVGILVFNIALMGCKKEDIVKPVALENTTWKLTKEIWYFANGNVQTFIKQDNLDWTFTFFFLNNRDITILNEPYTVEEIGTWTRVDDRLTMTVSIDNHNTFIKHYKILELTDQFMKVDFEDQHGESSEDGKAIKMVYELSRQ
jgi:hypothetical protein